MSLGCILIGLVATFFGMNAAYIQISELAETEGSIIGVAKGSMLTFWMGIAFEAFTIGILLFIIFAYYNFSIV